MKAFDTETAGSSYATGFVVDAARGILLTNRHVVKPGPVLAEVRHRGGSVALALRVSRTRSRRNRTPRAHHARICRGAARAGAMRGHAAVAAVASVLTSGLRAFLSCAQAVFLNREEIPVQALYRDPVHDFGFFKFDPKALQFMEARPP